MFSPNKEFAETHIMLPVLSLDICSDLSLVPLRTMGDMSRDDVDVDPECEFR